MVGKMKYEASGIAIIEYVGLKPNIYSFLVNGINEHEKIKGVNKNAFATINHNEYKDVLLNNICLRHSMNRNQNHRIGTYEIDKISLSCVNDKMYILKSDSHFQKNCISFASLKAL